MVPRGRSTQEQEGSRSRGSQSPSLSSCPLAGRSGSLRSQPLTSPVPRSACPQFEMDQRGLNSKCPLGLLVCPWSNQLQSEGGVAWHKHSSAGPPPVGGRWTGSQRPED